MFYRQQEIDIGTLAALSSLVYSLEISSKVNEARVTNKKGVVKVKNELDATKYAVFGNKTACFVTFSWFFTFTISTMHDNMNIKKGVLVFYGRDPD
jgi:hypothetical protein